MKDRVIFKSHYKGEEYPYKIYFNNKELSVKEIKKSEHRFEYDLGNYYYWLVKTNAGIFEIKQFKSKISVEKYE